MSTKKEIFPELRLYILQILINFLRNKRRML
nr:MAG TPA: hypothetical protein [Caudoviricetes sp.]